MKAGDLTKIYEIHQQAQRLIDQMAEIDCDTNARERKPFITMQNGLLRARFSAGNILIMNGCFLSPQSQYDALNLKDYDEKEVIERESEYDTVYNYTYYFPHGTIIVEAVESCGEPFAEIRSAYWYDPDGKETKLK